MSRSPLNYVIAGGEEPLFSMPLGEDVRGWEVPLAREGVWKRWRTLGQVAVLEGEELEVSFAISVFCLDFLATGCGVGDVSADQCDCRKRARCSTMR